MTTLIEKFLFEKDLEYSVSNYFKKDSSFKLGHVSDITGCDIRYTGSQLMSLFSIEAEIEVNNIIKMKYGNRVKHIGGTDVSDVIIQGTPFAFNIKTLHENSGSIKLCSVNAPSKLNGLEYRFIALTYKMSEDNKEVVFDAVYVFNFDFIRDVLIARDNNFYIAKGKVLEYILRRDAFVNGECSSFKRLTVENMKESKPPITRDNILPYVKKKGIIDIDSIKKRFKSDFSFDNLSMILNSLKEEGVISLKDNEVRYNRTEEMPIVIIENNLEDKKISKARKAFDLYLDKKLSGISNLKQFRTYLTSNYSMTNKLASHYTCKIIKEKGININEIENSII